MVPRRLGLIFIYPCPSSVGEGYEAARVIFGISAPFIVCQDFYAISKCGLDVLVLEDVVRPIYSFCGALWLPPSVDDGSRVLNGGLCPVQF